MTKTHKPTRKAPRVTIHNPSNPENATIGLRYNNDKPRMSLIDGFASTELAKVLTLGAKKYAAHNWRKGLKVTECLDSLERHIAAFKEGENVDQETQLHHMAHAMCNTMFLVWMMQYRPEMDDRWSTLFASDGNLPIKKMRELINSLRPDESITIKQDLGENTPEGKSPVHGSPKKGKKIRNKS